MVITEDVYWNTVSTEVPTNPRIDKYNEKFIIANNKTIEHISLDRLVNAPPEYNIFSTFKTNPAKLLEMKFSIRSNGLFNPIIVWKEKQGNNYMILSGHTRYKLYKELYQEAKAYQDGSEKKYATIPAIVYGAYEIDELKAKEIIIDTNYIQRDLDKRYIPFIVSHRVEIVKQQKDRQGKTLDIVAEELNMGRTAVYENLVLATRVIDSLASYYYEGLLRKKNVIRFSFYDEITQYKIYETCKSHFTNAKVCKLKPGMSFKEIYKLFTTYETPTVSVSFQVKSQYAEEFKKDVERLIKRKKYDI